jgi:hypothetical protein
MEFLSLLLKILGFITLIKKINVWVFDAIPYCLEFDISNDMPKDDAILITIKNSSTIKNLPEHRVLIRYKWKDKIGEIDLTKGLAYDSKQFPHLDIIQWNEQIFYNTELICEEKEMFKCPTGYITGRILTSDPPSEKINPKSIADWSLDILNKDGVCIYSDEQVGRRYKNALQLYYNGGKITPYVTGSKICVGEWEPYIDDTGNLIKK